MSKVSWVGHCTRCGAAIMILMRSDGRAVYVVEPRPQELVTPTGKRTVGYNLHPCAGEAHRILEVELVT